MRRYKWTITVIACNKHLKVEIDSPTCTQNFPKLDKLDTFGKYNLDDEARTLLNVLNAKNIWKVCRNDVTTPTHEIILLLMIISII